MQEEFFVIVAARTSDGPSEVAMIKAEKPIDAHTSAAKLYREKYAMTPNIHVRTNTLYRTKEASDAILFIHELEKKILEHKDDKEGSDEST